MMITRRNALRLACGGLGLGLGLASGFPDAVRLRRANAQTIGVPGKTLIKIFMRGGADGLYLFPPYGDSNYRRLRPQVAIERPSDSDPNSAFNLNGFIGMHPNFISLMEIWENNDLAIFPATHFYGASRSHFENQRWVEQGLTGTTDSGYLNRYLFQSPGDSPFRALGAGGSDVPTVLQGGATVPSIRDIGDFTLEHRLWCDDGNDCVENRLMTRLETLYAKDGTLQNPIEDMVLAQGTSLLGVLEQLKSLDAEYEVSADGLDYSNSSLGKGLRLIAQGIKADLGIELAAINWSGGWDSHSNQRPPNRSPTSTQGMHGTIRRGGDDLLTFYRDLGPRMQDVIVVIGTEFGRTSKQNGSFGTDHGHAAAWMLMGGSVNGGIYGAWPGLSEQDLYKGRFLEMSVNYKDVVSEALVRHLGMDEALLPTVFPDHSVTDLGAVSA